jgi:hypothetical protein
MSCGGDDSKKAQDSENFTRASNGSANSGSRGKSSSSNDYSKDMTVPKEGDKEFPPAE